METKLQATIKSMSPVQQGQVQEVLKDLNKELTIDLSDIFDNMDKSALSKTLMGLGIDLFQEHVLPKIVAKSPKLGAIIAAVLDQIEAAVKK